MPGSSTGAAVVSLFAARQVSLNTDEGRPSLLGTGVGGKRRLRFNRQGLWTMANSSKLKTLAFSVVPGHFIQSGARRIDVESQVMHIKLADEVRNEQHHDRFNSLTREMCTQRRRPAGRLPRTSEKHLPPNDDDET